MENCQRTEAMLLAVLEGAFIGISPRVGHDASATSIAILVNLTDVFVFTVDHEFAFTTEKLWLFH